MVKIDERGLKLIDAEIMSAIDELKNFEKIGERIDEIPVETLKELTEKEERRESD